MAEVRVSDEGVVNRAWSAAQRIAVVQEMTHILDHPTFKSSRRCSALLQRLVDNALAGEEHRIKERTLGVEVFGRDADYDTNADPIVRRTANEIRKRLAQCYQDPNCHHLVRVRLVPGSYVPQFDFPDEGGYFHPGLEQEHHAAVETTGWPGTATAMRHVVHRGWIWVLAVLLLACAAGILFLRFHPTRSAESMLWKPLLDSGDQITVCIADENALLSGSGGSGSPMIGGTTPSSQTSPALPQQYLLASTTYLDAHAGNTISTRLSELKKEVVLQSSSALTLEELRRRPAVLIGGLNNSWTSILLSGLRYTIRFDTATQNTWIQDAQNPSNRDWMIQGKQHNGDFPVNYAIVTRFFDNETGHWILALGGLEAHATEAAGDLVANPALAKLLPPEVRLSGNIQIVLKTSVIRGATGPVEVVAVHTW